MVNMVAAPTDSQSNLKVLNFSITMSTDHLTTCAQVTLILVDKKTKVRV